MRIIKLIANVKISQISILYCVSKEKVLAHYDAIKYIKRRSEKVGVFLCVKIISGKIERELVGKKWLGMAKKWWEKAGKTGRKKCPENDWKLEQKMPGK